MRVLYDALGSSLNTPPAETDTRLHSEHYMQPIIKQKQTLPNAWCRYNGNAPLHSLIQDVLLRHQLADVRKCVEVMHCEYTISYDSCNEHVLSAYQNRPAVEKIGGRAKAARHMRC